MDSAEGDILCVILLGLSAVSVPKFGGSLC